MPLIDLIPAVRSLRAELARELRGYSTELVKAFYRERDLTILLALAQANERLLRGEVAGEITVEAGTPLQRRRGLGLGATERPLVTGAARSCPILRIAVERVKLSQGEQPLDVVDVEVDAGASGTWIAPIAVTDLLGVIRPVPAEPQLIMMSGSSYSTF